MVQNIINMLTIIGLTVTIALLPIVILSLVTTFNDYMNAKRAYIEKQTESEVFNALLTRAQVLKIESKTIGTLLDAIDELIIVEISTIFKTYIGLGQKYEYIKMEEDIIEVSNQVFNALRKEYIFNNDHTILTDEYIMRYIQNQTMTIFIKTVQEFNDYLKYR
jgi:hypothetical protein